MATKRGITRRDDLAKTCERLDMAIQRHEDMLAVTFRRIADIQAEVDALTRERNRAKEK